VHFDLLAKLLADDRRSAADDWLRERADPGAPFRVETQSHPMLGHPAPDFTLRDQRGQPWALRQQLRQGPVVLVFYLGYFCDACVCNLTELNADRDRFHSLGAEVVAVSGDAADLTRRRFEEYGRFDFPVLSDPGHAVAQSFGVFRPAQGLEREKLLHGTFLIGRDGQVHWVHTGDTPFGRSKALLGEVARLERRLPAPEWARVPAGKEQTRP
jgi:peroxiredoxin